MVGTRPGDFLRKVRKLIAERAGYRCSKPDCRRPTLGPGPGPADVACIGVACHIYPAQPGGPRGGSGLPVEELQAASNGIWLCADHARLIDANQGRGYPPGLLRAWRQLHETYLTQEMRGLTAPRGLITEITVHQGPGALTARSIPLSVLNLITGYNNIGKSTVLDLLASPAGHGAARERHWHGELAADIQWFDPQPHALQLRARDGQLGFRQDGTPLPFLPAPYRPVYLKIPRCRIMRLHDWARLLGLDVNAFLRVIAEVPERVQGEVSGVAVACGSPEVRLRSWPQPVQLDGHPGDAAAWTVIFETAIALAQVQSQAGPTLLLVDDFGDFLHPSLACKMFELLTNLTEGFQTIVVTHYRLPNALLQQWSVTSLGHAA
jgi:hypothetical protein